MSNKAFDQRQNISTNTAGTGNSKHIETNVIAKNVPANGIDGRRRRFLLSSVGSAVSGPIALGFAFRETKAEARAPESGTASVRIARDFADPLLELVRLLSEAAEIEHDLMVQYLYAGFSLKPDYEALIGAGTPDAESFLGVAIQEMQHLAIVNRLLIALGAAPVLKRRDFPYEIDIYPFPFEMEPLSLKSLAKYVYCEAPVGAFFGGTGNDPALSRQMRKALDKAVHINHVGSLYDRIIELLAEIDRESPKPLKESRQWRDRLLAVKDQGEVDHFNFFRSVFMATHPAFEGVPDPWRLPTDDPRFPAYSLPRNPTAYEGYPNTIADAEVRALAWLGNLVYWSTLLFLDLAYRDELDDGVGMARQLMQGPLWSLARHLPTRGYGLPFDPLSMGSDMAPTRKGRLALLKRFLAEGHRFAKRHAKALPDDFSPDVFSNLADGAP